MLVSASTSQDCAACVCNLRAPCGRRCDLDPARLPRRLAGQAAWPLPPHAPSPSRRAMPTGRRPAARLSLARRPVPPNPSRQCMRKPDAPPASRPGALGPDATGREMRGRLACGTAVPRLGGAAAAPCRPPRGWRPRRALPPPPPQPPAGRCRALRRKAPRQAYFSSHTAAVRPRVKYRPAGRAP